MGFFFVEIVRIGLYEEKAFVNVHVVNKGVLYTPLPLPSNRTKVYM